MIPDPPNEPAEEATRQIDEDDDLAMNEAILADERPLDADDAPDGAAE